MPPVLAMEGWLFSEGMLVSMLSVHVEPLEVSCTEPPLIVCLPCADLNPEDSLTPFLLICDLRKLNLSGIECCLSASTLGV